MWVLGTEPGPSARAASARTCCLVPHFVLFCLRDCLARLGWLASEPSALLFASWPQRTVHAVHVVYVVHFNDLQSEAET